MDLKKTFTSAIICAAMAGSAAPAFAQTAPTLPQGRPPSGGEITPLPGDATTNSPSTDRIAHCQYHTSWQNYYTALWRIHPTWDNARPMNYHMQMASTYCNQ